MEVEVRRFGCVSVKTAYVRLMSLMEPVVLWGDEEKRVFRNLWKGPAPSKMVAFGWKVLLDRVPTKANLALRNVFDLEMSLFCVLCNGSEETSNHLFLHWHFVSSVWSSLMLWLNWYFIILHNLFAHLGVKKNWLRGLW